MAAEYKMEIVPTRYLGVEGFRVLGYRNGVLALDRRAMHEGMARTIYLEWERKQRAKEASEG